MSVHDPRCPLCGGQPGSSELVDQVAQARALAVTLRDVAVALDQAATTLASRIKPVGSLPLTGRDIVAGAVDTVRRRFGVGSPIHYAEIHRAMQLDGLTVGGDRSGLPALLSQINRSKLFARHSRGRYVLLDPVFASVSA